MKKQYIFVSMIGIILYISYLILSFTINEYKVKGDIEYIKKLNKGLQNQIVLARDLIKYSTSRAYKNKILKGQQSFKNKGEKVVYFTNQDTFDKYTRPIHEITNEIEQIEAKEENSDLRDMEIPDKWMHFLFGRK